MRYFLLLLLFCFPAMAQNNTLKTIPYLDGVPILDRFELIHESVLIFDKPEGQIVELSLGCYQDCPETDAVLKDYEDALSALGWQKSDDMYTKNGQKLQIGTQSQADKKSPLILTFRSEG